MRPELGRKIRTSLLLMALMLSSAIVGAITVNATISSTPTAYISPYSCEKGANIIVAVDNSATPVYSAIQGSGSAITPCGQTVYGGPNNAGGVTGTSGIMVINDALAASNPGVVLLEAGTFTLTSQLQVNNNGVTLEGQGSATDVVFTSAITSDAISLNANQITMAAFNIDCTALPKESGGLANNCIDLQAKKTGIEISNIAVTATNTHSMLQVFSYQATVIQSTFSGGYFEAIGIGGGARNFVFSDNSVTMPLSSTNGNGIGLANDTNIQIIGNSITGGDYGIDLENGGASSRNIVISGNTFYQTGNDGIHASGGGNGVAITGNDIFESGHATKADGININSGGTGYTITGGVINSTTGSAIATSSSTNVVAIAGVVIFNASFDQSTVSVLINSPYTTFSGSTIIETHSAGLSLGSTAIGSTITGDVFKSIPVTVVALSVGASQVTISNSRFAKSSAAGAGSAEIKTSGTVSNILIEGNVLTSAATSIQLQTSETFITVTGNSMNGTIGVSTPVASNMITENQGFNPVAPSTYTACASACTYTNVDGYDETFTLLAINGISAWTCNGHAMPITLTDVTCTIAPGGSQVITWTVTAPTFTKVPLVA